MKLVIVGAGLAGKWLTIAAQRAGHSVTLVHDGNPSAETAALAMLRPSWLPKVERHLLKPSIELWDTVSEVHSGATITRWDNDTVKHQDDWFAIKPTLPPIEPDRMVYDTAMPLPDSEGKAVWGLRHDVVEGDQVVWCDGAGEGRRTFGCTWVHDDPAVLDTSFRVHHVAPYKVLAGVRFEDQARLGSSSAGKLESALKHADTLIEKAVGTGMIASKDGWQRVDGVRLKRDEYLTRDGSGWRWSGFHRNGYGLVPALADRVIEAVEML